jgi:hypothetical protein
MVSNLSLTYAFFPHSLSHTQTVWIVSSEQLLSWVQNPTKVGDLNNFAPLKCSTPQVDQKICNGMPDNEAGLLSHCAFSDFPFYTCVSDTLPLVFWCSRGC